MPESEKKEFCLALWALTAMVIAYVVIPALAALIGRGMPYAARSAASVVGGAAGIGIIIYGARMLAGSWRDALRFLTLDCFLRRGMLRALWLAPALILSAGVLTALWMFAGKKLGIEFTIPASTLVMSEGPMAARLTLAFSAVFIAPVFEEMVFRRAVYGAIASKCPAKLAAVLTALAFAALHLSLLQLPGLWYLGWAWQRVAVKDRSIWSSAMIHAFNNLIAACVVFLVESPGGSPETWT